MIGARDFLVAYNINLNTRSTRRANALAFDLREAGRVKRTAGPGSPIARDEDGKALREPGRLKGVKGIGWYIEEYGIAQVSLNLTNLEDCKLHEAFEAARDCARERGLRVTGSELVGLVPLEAMLEAGRYYLRAQDRSLGVPEDELVRIAIHSLGLDELAPFDPAERIIEQRLRRPEDSRLVELRLRAFTEEAASELPAPGGGSVAAAVGALGAAMGTMVANLSAGKSGWDERLPYFSDWALRGHARADALLALVDEDTRAFDRLMAAYRLPKGSAEEKAARSAEIQAATVNATEVPLRVMRESLGCFELCEAMAAEGLPSSVSDAGVGALCARAAIRSAWLNVKINAPGLKDRVYAEAALEEAIAIMAEAEHREAGVMEKVEEVIDAG